MQCVPSLLGKPLFLLKTIVCLSFQAVFCPPTHPPAGMPGGMRGWGGGVASAGVVCACGRLCSSHESAPTRAVFGWVQGVPETAPAEKTPHPYLGRQDCVVVWLPTPPPTEGQGWRGVDLGRCQPLFIYPPAHPRGDWDSSACLVLSPPNLGGRCLRLSPSGPGECYTMGSAALLALFGVWHTQSKLHAINVLCSAFLPSLANYSILQWFKLGLHPKDPSGTLGRGLDVPRTQIFGPW